MEGFNMLHIHKWDKWKKLKETFTNTSYKKNGEKEDTHNLTVYSQERKCLRCGKIEIEQLMRSNPYG